MQQNRKIFSYTSIVLVLLLLFTGCTTETSTVQTDANDENDLTQYQTDYVGDNTKVIQITSKQSYPEGYSYDHIEIQSKEIPYELIVYLKVEETEEKDSKEKLEDNATISFELIGNLEKIRYINAATAEEIATFTRESNN